MQPLRASLLVLTLSAALAGCDDTNAEDEPTEIPGHWVARAAHAVSEVGHLSAEVAWAVGSEGEGLCPFTVADGGHWSTSFTDGCVPDSGFSELELGGQLDLDVAGDDMFVGTIANMGVAPTALNAEVSGAVSLHEQLFSASVELTGGEWLVAGKPQELDAIFDIEGDGSELGFTIDGGTFNHAGGVPVDMWVEALTFDIGALGGCVVPNGGRIRLERNNAAATAVFDADSAANGEVSVVFTDRATSETVTLCP